MSTIKYSCSICKRQIDILEKSYNLTVYGKCIITNGCKGKLNKISKNKDNNRESLPNSVDGLDDYVPRKIFYNHEQFLSRKLWKVTHNLGVSPVVEVYVNSNNTELKFDEYTISIVDKNTILLEFPNAYSGIAQCIARSSVIQNSDIKINNAELHKVSYNGIFVFAFPKFITKFTGLPLPTPLPTLPINTEDEIKPIRLEVSITRPNREEIICTEIISDELLNSTPWINWNEILLRKRRNYSVKTKNILNFNRTFQEDVIKKEDIENGTKIRFLRVDFGTGMLQPIEQDDVLLLLASKPYQAIDKIRNKVVDVSHVNFSPYDYFIYENGEIYTIDSNVENIYPIIQRVD